MSMRERIIQITGETDHALLNDIQYMLEEQGISEVDFTPAMQATVRQTHNDALREWAANREVG